MLKILVTGGNGNIANIIKRNLNEKYNMTYLSRQDINILDYNQLYEFLKDKTFDILIHTAIQGGRRTKEETSDVFYNNLKMFENLIMFNDKFKMIINLDSAAIYNRKTDILNRKENDIYTIPEDFYGFSKYLIYKRTLNYDNLINFRIFNIFHPYEENDRFIKSCFLAKKNNTMINIYEDKYFDFFYENDFIKVLDYYLENINKLNILEKTINLCYNEKLRLSDIAKLIIKDNKNINIIKTDSYNNYSGNSNLLNKYKLNLLGFEKSIKDYESKTLNI